MQNKPLIIDIKPSNTKEAKNNKSREKRPPKKITETYLHNSGLYYLQRFSASAHQFKEVMLRKARKSCQHHEEQDMERCTALIDALVTKFEVSGLLNDEAYTRGMVTSLRRQGKSSRAIIMKLRNKGLSEEAIKKKLEEHDTEDHESKDEAEFSAAMIFARKKRIGPFDKNIEIDHKKSLGKLARAGFSFDTSRRVLDLTSEEI